MPEHCERWPPHKCVISSEKILTAAIYFGRFCAEACVRVCILYYSAKKSLGLSEWKFTCVRFWLFCEIGAHQITPLFLIILLPPVTSRFLYVKQAGPLHWLTCSAATGDELERPARLLGAAQQTASKCSRTRARIRFKWYFYLLRERWSSQQVQ